MTYCRIIIHKSNEAGGPVFDATYYQVEGGLATIQLAENRPGSASFTLVNRYDVPGQCLTADTFAGWSDGSTGAIKTGLFVELTTEDGAPIMDGRISTVSPKGDTVAFEVADYIALLGRTGSALRRNYRQKGATREGIYPARIADNGDVILDWSQHMAEAGGTPQAVFWNISSGDIVLTRTDSTRINQRGTAYFSGSAIVDGDTYTYGRTVKISFKMALMSRLTYRMTVSMNSAESGTMRFKVIEGTSTDHDSTYLYVNEEFNVYDLGIIPFPQDLNFSVYFDILDGKYSGPGSDQGYRVVVDPSVRFVMDRREQLPGGISSPYVRGNTAQLDPNQYSPEDHRAYILYTIGKRTTPSIMGEIARAVNFDVSGDDSAPANELALYRVGGLYALDYLQKLADITTGDNAPLSFTADGINPTLRIGARRRVSDGPQYLIRYAADEPEPELAEFLISSFAPQITKKNRPNRITIKATISTPDGQEPITATIEDSDSVAGSFPVESIINDSSATSMLGVGSALWGELKSRELDQWEGTVTIYGIVPVWIEHTGTYAGSGATVRIKDSRVGIDSVVRVRQVLYNFNDCTTQLTVGNYDIRYSSAISNTNALAVQASDMLAGISETSLYDQQYIYLNAPMPDVIETMSSITMLGIGFIDREITHSDAVYLINQAPATVIRYPNGRIMLLARFTEDTGTYLDPSRDYGITHIAVGGRDSMSFRWRWTKIENEYIRPDFFQGQTLTVCLLI